MITTTDHELASRLLKKRVGEKDDAHAARVSEAAKAISDTMLPERQTLADLVSRLEQVQADPTFKQVFESAKAQGVLFRGKPWKEELERAQAIVETYPMPQIET